MTKKVSRLGLEERYYFENGGRDFLIEKYGLSSELIRAEIENFN